ncbi:MAG: exonuclease SbcCD subunit D [Clostridia bacterium]|nr:exonuclease SbcCD subunit D [Clostridia bacterium]
MRLIHLSDLHIGKRVNEYSMIEDQEFILNQIYSIIVDKGADGVIIAGDVYDKTVPTSEAVTLLDDFLSKLAKRKIPVYMIGGNHDSQERLSFGSALMEGSGVYISKAYEGEVRSITLTDEYGEISIYMLPFVKPINVRKYFEDEEISSYTDAIRVVLENTSIDTDKRNILIAHQFVTGSRRSASEELSIGGLDNVDSYVFKNFDYVALGHIHSPQCCGEETIRYCGTPLKYSFSEARDKKSVTVVDLFEKGRVEISTVPLNPRRDMIELRGSYNELMSKSFYEGTTYQEDYVHITLTDEEDILNGLGNLRVIYKNLMKLDYDNQRTRQREIIFDGKREENKTPLLLFSELYQKQNNKKMTDEQEKYISSLIEEIWEGEK